MKMRRRRCVGVAGALIVLALPGGALAQVPAGAGNPAAGSGPRAVEVYPEFRRAREITMFGLGAAMLVVGHVLGGDRPVVPPQGLDPEVVALSMDRRILGHVDPDAHVASNRTRNAAVLLPFVMALATAESGERWDGFGRRSAVIIQAFTVSQGITSLGKSVIGRARPYTYLPSDARFDDPAYDVTSKSAFSSMPSGHSSSAWTGAALAMSEFLLSEPDAGWMPRSGVGLVGGALAGATSALRVEAGQHFPSDVLVGAGIGILAGVAVPLLHHDERPLPSARAWFEMTGGAVAGTLIGVLFARSF